MLDPTEVYTQNREENLKKLSIDYSVASSDCARLLLKTEFFDNGVVTFLVVALQVLQMRAAVCNHLQESAAGVLVLKVFLQMRGQFVNALRQNSDLYLRRARVLIMNSGFLYNLGLFLLSQHVRTLAQPIDFCKG